MKKIIFIVLLFSSINGIAQAYDSSAHYEDTLITLQLTQRSALYIGYYVKQGYERWGFRLAPSTFKPYIGTGTHLDSLFTVQLKSFYINGLIETLLTRQNEVVQADRLSIINNNPSIPGYVSLAAQILAKSNGSSNEKNVATFVLSYYNRRIAELAALRTQIITDVVNWSNN